MEINTFDPVVQTETTMYTDRFKELRMKYCVNGVVSCGKCPLDTEENINLCPGGTDEDCLEAIEKFLEDKDRFDTIEESISLEEAGERIEALEASLKNDEFIDGLRKKFRNVATKQESAVNHPSHYTSGKIECIDAIECAVDSYDDPKAAFLVGQVIKYLWRAPLKNAYQQDIEKAQWYLNRLVAQFDEKEN